MPEPPAPRSQGPAPRSRGPAQAPWLGVGKEQLGKDVAWLLLGGWAKAWGVVERRRDPGSGGGGWVKPLRQDHVAGGWQS